MRAWTFRGWILVLLAPWATAEETVITHGPILGRPSAHQVGVWARTSRPGTFRVRYGRVGADLGPPSVSATTRLESDNTAWILVDGLDADTTYRYEIAVEGGTAGRRDPLRSGTFRTLPESQAYRDPETNPAGLFNFAFEFGCCNYQPPGRREKIALPIFDTILKMHGDEIQFAIQNGDWIYEDFRDYSQAQWRTQVGIDARATPEVVRTMPAITGAWENYKVYLDRSDSLSRWHRQMPVLFTFDDHEIVDDSAGAGSVGARPRRALFRDIGVRAWYDYLGWANPVPGRRPIHFGVAELAAGSDTLRDASTDFTRLDLARAAELHVHWGGPDAGQKDKKYDAIGGDPNAGVYRIVRVLDAHRLQIEPRARVAGRSSYSIGQLSYFRQRVANCDFLFLDTRSHRQLPAIDNPKQPGLSLLGETQKAWLKRAVAESDADCFFVVSSVNFMIPHIVDVGEKGFTGYCDSWPAFWNEREELIDLFEKLGRPVFILTGDLHNSFVVKVSDRVWEFASAPHSSGNAGIKSEGSRPPSGEFDSYGRKCAIRWSTWFDNTYAMRTHPAKTYCIAKVNNVFFNPTEAKKSRWQAFPQPQVVFQYFDGLTGKLRYAESVVLAAPVVGQRRSLHRPQAEPCSGH